MNNVIYIAAAGSGKTTFIINQVESLREQNMFHDKKVLIVTYTDNNQNNIRKKIVSKYGYIPKNICIIGWFNFLLDYWIRPFKGTVIESLYDCHVGLHFVSGISGLVENQGRYQRTYSNDTEKFLYKNKDLYSDKLAEFAYKCWKKNKDELINRLSNIIDTLYIDEAQDLGGWDFDLIKILFESETINCVLCTDPRQRTYTTSASTKHREYNGEIACYVNDKVNSRNQIVTIDKNTLSFSHRCIAEICSFATTITPKHPPTKMCSCQECNQKRQNYTLQKGIFLVREKDVNDYVNTYNPLSLVWDKDTKLIVNTRDTLTWGSSKGLEAKATLIYLTKAIKKYYNPRTRKRIDLKNITRSKFYVAITRAMYVSGLVVPNNFDNSLINLPFWEKE